MEGSIPESWHNCIINQFRLCNFLENILEKKDQFLYSFDKLTSNYKVVVIYIIKQSLTHLSNLGMLVEELSNKGYMISIMVIPYGFVKPEYRLNAGDFFMVASEVDKIISKIGNTVYGDFPVYGIKYKNLEGCCPGNLFMLNMFSDGNISPCKSSKKIIGNIKNMSLVQAWHKWCDTLENFESRCSCTDFTVCRGGCIANQECNCDVYCEKFGQGSRDLGI